MVTVKYRDYTESFPHPSSPLQLLTAIRIGVKRMREKHDEFKIPPTLDVYLDGRLMDPKDADRVIRAHATIELEYADPALSDGVTLFQLDL